MDIQLYKILFSHSSKEPRDDQLQEMVTTQEYEVVRAFESFKNKEYVFLKVFEIPSWKEITEVEVNLK